MNSLSINNKFETIKKNTGIKDSLTIHCFRKTRATIMFSSRNPTYDDSEMAKYFGWKTWTVHERRNEYDLRTEKDLQDKIIGKTAKIETYDIVKQERDSLIDKQEKIINKLMNKINELESFREEVGEALLNKLQLKL